jgi:hypothetical protein
MKSSILGAGALACALALSGCGGGGEDLYLAGSVSGVTRPGLVLQNNGGNDLPIEANATSFRFTNLVASDSAYEIKATSIPSNAEECTITNGTGNSLPFNIVISVNCKLKTHALGGTVTGLGDAKGLVLVNGSDRILVEAAPGTTEGTSKSFTMAKVAEDAPYGVTVLTQPANRSCSVTNGGGTMGTTDIANVQVTCAAPN